MLKSSKGQGPSLHLFLTEAAAAFADLGLVGDVTAESLANNKQLQNCRKTASLPKVAQHQALSYGGLVSLSRAEKFTHLAKATESEIYIFIYIFGLG